jgi:Domain of unknown function (DUF4304)
MKRIALAVAAMQTGEAMTTAPEMYRVLLRDRVAPALRAMGFKGSGRLYKLDDGQCFARLGFQASRYNTLGEVRFAINLCVVGRRSWAEARERADHLPEVPQVGVYYGTYAEPGFSARLGNLFPDPVDHWWTIRREEPAEAVAEEVIAAVRDYGLPALLDARRRVGDDRTDTADA